MTTGSVGACAYAMCSPALLEADIPNITLFFIVDALPYTSTPPHLVAPEHVPAFLLTMFDSRSTGEVLSTAQLPEAAFPALITLSSSRGPGVTLDPMSTANEE